MVNELIDLCGRSAIMFPTEQQWHEPAMRGWLEKLNKGATGEAYDRLKIARVIRDLYLTDWGSRLALFENFNGTPLQTLLSLTMKRAEFTGSGPFAAFARRVCGIEAKDTMTEYKATVDYAKAQDAGRREAINVQAAE
jgi:4-hydroxyphenylacetate 3-monooxygenase/chlorophenol-4-monooxygenase component 2